MAAQQPAMAPDAELYRAESRASAAAARNRNLDMERSISNANHDRTLANSLSRNKHNSQDNNNSNDGTGSGIANNESAETLDEVDIERLGRMRPACFQSWYAEIGFVSVVVTSMMMSEYFISGFNIILPYVARSLDIPDSSRTWPAAAINLSTAALLLPFARMCDLYGGRTVFLAGHAWACIWTIVSGFSQNPVMLIVCRAMQGVGVGAFVPAGLALLGQTYRPGPRKNMVFAVWGALACLGFYFGIFMGAICVEFLTWSWFFYIGAILLVVIVIAGWFSIPKNLHDIDPTIKMDWLGVITIIPGLSLVVFAFTDGGHAPDGWKTPYIYVTLILGVLFLIAGVYTQGWVAKQPLLPPELFKPKYMKRLCVVLFCCYGCYGLFLFYASF
jgi:MFS family permease